MTTETRWEYGIDYGDEIDYPYTEQQARDKIEFEKSFYAEAGVDLADLGPHRLVARLVIIERGKWVAE